MKISLIALSEKGISQAEKIRAGISEKYGSEHIVELYCYEKYSACDAVGFESISQLTASIFKKTDAIVFICACGIAVRAVAPCVEYKAADPAVLDLDERGHFVISLLSGHLGGANRLAYIISEILGAEPVITTATDIGGLFSPDSFARANGLLINDMKAAKDIASAVLSGKKIGLYSELPCKNIPDVIKKTSCGRFGLSICENVSFKPFETTLTLIPKNIIIGIGCKKGISVCKIEAHVHDCFRRFGLSEDRIYAAATIDVKKDEEGLIEFCRRKRIPLRFFTAAQLMSVSGNFSSSEFVRKSVGADNVCERSAVCTGGRLVMPKQAFSGVTVAAAVVERTIDFNREIL